MCGGVHWVEGCIVWRRRRREREREREREGTVYPTKVIGKEGGIKEKKKRKKRREKSVCVASNASVVVVVDLMVADEGGVFGLVVYRGGDFTSLHQNAVVLQMYWVAGYFAVLARSHLGYELCPRKLDTCSPTHPGWQRLNCGR